MQDNFSMQNCSPLLNLVGGIFRSFQDAADSAKRSISVPTLRNHMIAFMVKEKRKREREKKKGADKLLSVDM